MVQSVKKIAESKQIQDKKLGGGFNPFEQYAGSSNWIISSSRGEHKKHFKQPPTGMSMVFNKWIITSL